MHTHTRSMAVPEPGALFRTRTGQTGRDAYINEATAIANAKRELDERTRELLEAMRAEGFAFYHSSDYDPRLGAGLAENAGALAEYILKGRCGCDACERAHRAPTLDEWVELRA